MKKDCPLAHAMPWVAAMLAAVLLDLPHAFTQIVLPLLAAQSLRMTASPVCRHGSAIR